MKQMFIYTFIYIWFIFVVIISFNYYSTSNNNLSFLYNSLRNTINESIVPEIGLVKKQLCRGSSKDSNRMWTFRPIGRLGNQIGQYATLYTLAKLNGHPAYIVPRMHATLSTIFKINLPVIPQEVDERIKWKLYGIRNWMSPEYRNISGQYVKMFGVPCSWTFYHHMREEILRELSFHDFVKEEANSYLAKVQGNRKNITYIGVHVRRGDYLEIMPKKWKGVVADKGFFQKSMDYFRKKYENPLFIVTSNGMDWCRQNINNSLGDVHFAGDGNETSPARDFALLTHCNHSIITIGTFGIWVAYLTGGETVYLSDYLLPNSPYFSNFKFETSYLPEWVGIPADLSPLLKKNKKTIRIDSKTN